MKKIKYVIHTFLALLFLLVFSSGMTAQATAPVTPVKAPAQVTGLKQTDANSSSIDVEWTSQLAQDITYHIEVSEDGKNWVEKETSYNSNSKYISGLNAGATYYVRVRAAVKDSDYNDVYGPYSVALECVTKPDKTPEYLKKIASTTNSITMEWGVVPGATLYEVRYYVKGTDSQTAKILYTNKNMIVLENLQQNQLYSVEVNGIRTTSNGSFRARDTSYAYTYSVGVTPTKVTGAEVKYYWNHSGEVVFVCDELNSADGYEAEIWSNYKKKDTKIGSGSASYNTSIRVQKNALKKVNFLKGRVRAYSLTDDGKKVYGDWSDWVYFAQQCEIKDINSTKKGMQVVWKKMQGADRYTLYASTKQKSGYKKVTTTKKTKYLVKKINKKAFKKGKTYYFYVKAERKVGKKYYATDVSRTWYITKLR